LAHSQNEININPDESSSSQESVNSDNEEIGQAFNPDTIQSQIRDNQTSPSISGDTSLIQQFFGQKAEEIGTESDENSEPFKLFNTPEEVKKLLTKEPKFIYDPGRSPDPMIIPWVRDQLLANEKLDKAKQLFLTKDYESVLQICNDIIENYKNFPEIQKQSEDLLEKTKKEITDARLRPTSKGVDKETIQQVELPPAVRSGTKGILFSDNGQALALVNDDILSVGDEVPNNKGVFVEDIKKTGEVIYRYKGVLFPVTVKTLP
jgi:hypothetical protein